MRARYPEASLFGCDISDVKLAMAKRACPDAELFFSALSDLPRSSCYDVVFLMEVLEHTVDPEAVVRRLLDIVSATRSEEHTSELQSLMRTSSAVFCLKKQNHKK